MKNALTIILAALVFLVACVFGAVDAAGYWWRTLDYGKKVAGIIAVFGLILAYIFHKHAPFIWWAL